jgi:hypothetical protein
MPVLLTCEKWHFQWRHTFVEFKVHCVLRAVKCFSECCFCFIPRNGLIKRYRKVWVSLWMVVVTTQKLSIWVIPVKYNHYLINLTLQHTFKLLSLQIWDHILYHHKTNGKTIVLCSLILSSFRQPWRQQVLKWIITTISIIYSTSIMSNLIISPNVC